MSVEYHIWWIELTDGTKFPFLENYDDGVTDPLTTISGFDRDTHWMIQAPLSEVGASGGPLPEEFLFHPLASGVDLDASGFPTRPFSNRGRAFTGRFPGRGRPEFPGPPFKPDPPGGPPRGHPHGGPPGREPGDSDPTAPSGSIPVLYLVPKSEVVSVFSQRVL